MKTKHPKTILRKARGFDGESKREYETWLDKHGPKFFAFDSPEEAEEFLATRIHGIRQIDVCSPSEESNVEKD